MNPTSFVSFDRFTSGNGLHLGIFSAKKTIGETWLLERSLNVAGASLEMLDRNDD